jgi:hypothetical protein
MRKETFTKFTLGLLNLSTSTWNSVAYDNTEPVVDTRVFGKQKIEISNIFLWKDGGMCLRDEIYHERPVRMPGKGVRLPFFFEEYVINS